MDSIMQTLDNISAKAEEKMQYNTFYVDKQGLRRCKVCNKRFETLINVPGMQQFDHKVNCVCDCGEEQIKKYRAEARRVDLAGTFKPENIFDNVEYTAMTFTKDEYPQSEAGRLCRRWVAHYDKNKENKSLKWLFLHGGKGKTFYSACIANYMSAKGYETKMTSLSRIAADISSTSDRYKAYNKYTNYELLIIEDITADGVTDTMRNLVLPVIIDRKRENKAVIMTSNMTTAETGNPDNKSVERIMQVIWEKGYPIELKGDCYDKVSQ